MWVGRDTTLRVEKKRMPAPKKKKKKKKPGKLSAGFS